MARWNRARSAAVDVYATTSMTCRLDTRRIMAKHRGPLPPWTRLHARIRFYGDNANIRVTTRGEVSPQRPVIGRQPTSSPGEDIHNGGTADTDPRQSDRLRHPGRVLRLRSGDRVHGPTPDLRFPRLLPVGTPAPRLGDRTGLRIGQPGRRRDHGHVGQRRPARPADPALLLGRRGSRDALPGRRDDALSTTAPGSVRSPSSC